MTDLNDKATEDLLASTVDAEYRGVVESIEDGSFNLRDRAELGKFVVSQIARWPSVMKTIRKRGDEITSFDRVIDGLKKEMSKQLASQSTAHAKKRLTQTANWARCSRIIQSRILPQHFLDFIELKKGELHHNVLELAIKFDPMDLLDREEFEWGIVKILDGFFITSSHGGMFLDGKLILPLSSKMLLVITKKERVSGVLYPHITWHTSPKGDPLQLQFVNLVNESIIHDTEAIAFVCEDRVTLDKVLRLRFKGVV